MGISNAKKNASKDAEFCKQYQTKDWDGCEANEFFAIRFDTDLASQSANKSKDGIFNSIRIIKIAENDVYKKVAHLAFEKEKITKYLKNVGLEDISKEDIDVSTYKESYFNKCQEILNKLEAKSYPFQK